MEEDAKTHQTKLGHKSRHGQTDGRTDAETAGGGTADSAPSRSRQHPGSMLLSAAAHFKTLITSKRYAHNQSME